MSLPAAQREAKAWQVLGEVPDPEVPALSVVDLGLVREVVVGASGLEVVLTPTYSGCPATEVIERSVSEALEAAGLGPVHLSLRRAPAWSTDWISEAGRQKLLAYGIAPPGPTTPDEGIPMRWVGRGGPVRHAVACPRCSSQQTERLSVFGSTACKSLYRCVSCREPFEYFKPL